MCSVYMLIISFTYIHSKYNEKNANNPITPNKKKLPTPKYSKKYTKWIFLLPLSLIKLLLFISFYFVLKIYEEFAFYKIYCIWFEVCIANKISPIFSNKKIKLTFQLENIFWLESTTILILFNYTVKELTGWMNFLKDWMSFILNGYEIPSLKLFIG